MGTIRPLRTIAQAIDGTTPPLLPTLTTGSASADGLGMRMGQDRECVASRHRTRMTGVPCHESMNGIPDDVAGTMIPPKPASTGLGIPKQAPHSGRLHTRQERFTAWSP